jgi:multiple sugar transport system substrate-binding protein
MVVWINKNDLDKVGLPIPPMDWTWEDYREYARKLTWGEGPDKHYGSLFFNWDHYNVLEAYNMIDDNPYLKADGSLNLDNPYFRSSMDLRYTLEQVDKTQLPIAEIAAMSLDYRSVFFSNRVSMMVMFTNIIPQAANLTDFPHDFVTTFVPVPRARENGRLGYVYGDNRYYSIGATSKYPEEAYKYLRYFTTEGIPMKNVTFTAENTPAFSMEQMVDRMVSAAPQLYDVAQLKKLLTWPDLHVNIWKNVPAFTGEILNLYWAEADKAAMGELTPDQVFANIIPQAEAIIERNKK